MAIILVSMTIYTSAIEHAQIYQIAKVLPMLPDTRNRCCGVRIVWLSLQACKRNARNANLRHLDL